MINFRLREAGFPSDRELFTPGSVKRIFEHSQGYPRRIAILCHNALEEVIIRDQGTIDERIIADIIKREEI